MWTFASTVAIAIPSDSEGRAAEVRSFADEFAHASQLRLLPARHGHAF
jgi:hypothetical protein